MTQIPLKSRAEMQGDLRGVVRELAQTYGMGSVVETLATLGPEDVFDECYIPSSTLLQKISEYESCNACEWRDWTSQQKGQLMEELAALSFDSLRLNVDMKSYQSYSAQLDLIVSSDGPAWTSLLRSFGASLSDSLITILVEAKNENARMTDAQFSRVCYLVSNQFDRICGLAVIFCRSGATGFPEASRHSPMRGLRDARATQMLFYAKTGKAVIVLEHDDILLLRHEGVLPKLIRKKLREISEATGLHAGIDNEELHLVQLPEHLQRIRIRES